MPGSGRKMTDTGKGAVGLFKEGSRASPQSHTTWGANWSLRVPGL